MAFSYTKLTGNGSNTVFTVPFPYLDRRHVQVTVNGVIKPFSWLTNGTIVVSPAPANGAVVSIRRYTPNTAPLVDFTDGATLTEKDLDLLALQSIFVNQEAVDLSAEIAQRIEDEGEASVGEIKTAIATLNNLSSDAVSTSVNALAVANEALERAADVEAVVSDVSAQVNIDAAIAVTAKDSAVAASNSALLAETSAQSWAGEAANSATAANTAKVAAEAAASVATAAANFNPDDFYTKVEVDAKFANDIFTISQVSGLQAALDGKANTSHTQAISTITGLQTALDGKLGVSSAAGSALKWATPRTITLTGDVSGSVSIDGSANVSIVAAVADDSHNHTVANIDGLQATLNGKVPTSRTVSAGNGLTGGGALSGNVTVTMGTPGTLSGSTTNSVTSTSHTHAISSTLARDELASSSAFSAGMFIMGRCDTATTFGDVYAGTKIRRSDANNNAGAYFSEGSFRAMGNSGANVATVFVRIS